MKAAGFRAWLKRQPAGSVVGYGGSHCACPVAKWLTSLRPHVTERPMASVGLTTLRLPGETAQKQTPAWMHLFIRRVDAKCGSQITREDALLVLAEVCQ